MARPRPTDAEFDELHRKRAKDMAKLRITFAAKWGVAAADIQMHDCSTGKCYCACPDGPCQHVWDGPEYNEENMSSVVTCSRCGEPAIYHDMRCGP
jgi:hypothetical protein